MGHVKNLSDKNVAVRGPDGKLRHILPGDVFPDWAPVENPLVLGDQELPDATKDAYMDRLEALDLSGAPAPLKKKRKAEFEAKLHAFEARNAESHGAVPDSEPDVAAPPPRAGRGATADAWADYALDHNVEVEEGQSRDDIIAACEKAGIPT